MPPLANFLCIVLSLLPVVTVVLLRKAVLLQRQTTIKALGLALMAKGVAKEKVEALPSFEFVKFKYFLKPGDTLEGERDTTDDFRAWQWLVGSFPLVMTLFCFYEFTIYVVLKKMFVNIPLYEGFLLATNYRLQWIVLASFVAAQANMYTNLVRAINNFDLNPLTFLETFLDVITGVTSGLLIYLCAPVMGSLVSYITDQSAGRRPIYSSVDIDNLGFLTLVIVAFAASYYPDVLIRNLIRVAKLSNYKREDDTIFKAFTATPIEIIDGVDSTIRKRLEDFHILSVQNLATANPLMLYVETPYGIYQMLDWVAQAQLISIFGDQKIKKLWELGVRTIFDLERFARDPACQNKEVSRALGALLFAESFGKQQGDVDWNAVFAASVNSALENSHVHRLRQIVILLSECIGSESRRLPFLPGYKCGVECVAGRLAA